MTPVSSKARENVAKHVTLCDGPVDIRYDDSLIVIPEENLSHYGLLALELGLNSEGDIVHSRSKVKLLKLVKSRSKAFCVANFSSSLGASYWRGFPRAFVLSRFCFDLEIFAYKSGRVMSLSRALALLLGEVFKR